MDLLRLARSMDVPLDYRPIGPRPNFNASASSSIRSCPQNTSPSADLCPALRRSGFRLLQCDDRFPPIPPNSDKSRQIKEVSNQHAILTWLDAVSMVRAAFKGDGA